MGSRCSIRSLRPWHGVSCGAIAAAFWKNAALEQGIPLAQMRAFLEARCAEPGIPQTVAALFAEAESRTGRIVDQGPARVYACSDPELARLVVSDSKLRRLCRLAEDRLLVVPTGDDKSFREALRQLGYAAPPASTE
ncbi:MAG: hypothetical protein GXY55_21820 [Phycisphaerae bacterium]|nr:hypothetical protein [Phycisphaerae bacterium]